MLLYDDGSRPTAGEEAPCGIDTILRQRALPLAQGVNRDTVAWYMGMNENDIATPCTTHADMGSPSRGLQGGAGVCALADVPHMGTYTGGRADMARHP